MNLCASGQLPKEATSPGMPDPVEAASPGLANHSSAPSRSLPAKWLSAVGLWAGWEIPVELGEGQMESPPQKSPF